MQSSWFSDSVRGRLTEFVQALVNQQQAHTVVPPDEAKSGYWFGGGNVIQDSDGSLLLVGRYRSGGDSRTGLKAGTRGRELTMLRSTDNGQTFTRVQSWDKAALSTPSADVLSIEGASLVKDDSEYRLYVSTEKELSYPEDLRAYQKPGSGVWSIDLLTGNSLDDLASSSIRSVLSGTDPSHLHLKDPFIWMDGTPAESAPDCRYRLGFCSHPFGWSSSNSGVAELGCGGHSVRSVAQGVLPRGTTWDVAMTRATAVLPVPWVGPFAERPHTLIFYCGGECLRPLDEHGAAVSRPRGYSCEELGSAAVFVDHDIATVHRLSVIEPLFVSPWGTGCSRYVDVCPTSSGYFTTWQQSQPDESQPLVAHLLTNDDAKAILA